MEIRQVRLSDVDVEPLLAGLSDEYDTRYGKNIEMTRANEDEFDHPHGLFVVLMDGPITAAGGGFRRYNQSTCEVKRMWTSPQYRRHGLATWVLRYLEGAARETGYATWSWRLDHDNLRPRRSTPDAVTGESRFTAITPMPKPFASISPLVNLTPSRRVRTSGCSIWTRKAGHPERCRDGTVPPRAGSTAQSDMRTTGISTGKFLDERFLLS